MGFRPQQAPPSPGLGKRAGAERSLDPTASSTGSSRLSSPGTPGASSQLLPSLLQPYLLPKRKGSRCAWFVWPKQGGTARKQSSESPGAPLGVPCSFWLHWVPGSSVASPASQGQQVSVCAPLPRCPSTLGLAEDPCRLPLSPDFSGCFL